MAKQEWKLCPKCEDKILAEMPKVECDECEMPYVLEADLAKEKAKLEKELLAKEKAQVEFDRAKKALEKME